MVAERLRRVLTLRKIKQKELAEMIGVTEVTICRWLQGNRQPDAEYIVKICKALSISSDWLLGLHSFENIPDLGGE